MPLYEISHAVDLSSAQQDQIAEAITKIHTEMFTAPRLFVNVRFSPSSDFIGYVGGKKTSVNSIVGHVRHGPSRTPEMYEEVMGKIGKMWAEIVPDNTDVRIFMMGSIVAGFEHGVSLPPAGGDRAWLKKNLPFFEKRAAAGNQEMKDLLEEIKTRNLAG